MTADAQLKRKKKRKLDPRAFVGYLVGYNSTNIFRIWIPLLRKVISTRDVIFDEFSFFDGKRDQQPLLHSQRQLIQKIQIPPSQQSQEEVLDEETEEETDVEAVEDNADFEEEEEEKAARSDDLDEEGDYRKAVELEYAYLPTPPLTEQEEDLEAAFSKTVPTERSQQAGFSSH
ncbi:reverse transcriptase (RNA-dependent DNA polymerase) [Hirsutella rhossiliensis]